MSDGMARLTDRVARRILEGVDERAKTAWLGLPPEAFDARWNMSEDESGRVVQWLKPDAGDE